MAAMTDRNLWRTEMIYDILLIISYISILIRNHVDAPQSCFVSSKWKSSDTHAYRFGRKRTELGPHTDRRIFCLTGSLCIHLYRYHKFLSMIWV